MRQCGYQCVHLCGGMDNQYGEQKQVTNWCRHCVKDEQVQEKKQIMEENAWTFWLDLHLFL